MRCSCGLLPIKRSLQKTKKKQAESLTCFVRISRHWDRYSHRGLASIGHQHGSCENPQTLASGRYRFPLGTFFLAGFGDCRLLELHLLDTLSHFGLRPPCVFILQNNKLIFFPEAVHTWAFIAGIEPAAFNWKLNALPSELNDCGLRGVHLPSQSFELGPEFAALLGLRPCFCPAVPSFRFEGLP